MANKNIIAKNTLALYFRTAVLLLVSLYVTRALLRILGETDYDIFNVVGSVVVFFTFLNSSITQAIQRFFSYEIGQGDERCLNRVFNSSLILQMLIALCLIILCETVGLWFLNHRLTIPEERLEIANLVFQMSILTFSVGIMRSPFEALVVAYEKMSFFAWTSIIEAALKLLTVLVLYKSSADKLGLYSIMLVLCAIVILCCYILFCKKTFSHIKAAFVFDSSSLASLASYFGWNTLGNASNVISQQCFIFCLNIFKGVGVNAAMGLANGVYSAVSSFVAGFQAAFRPQIVQTYSTGNREELNKLIYSTSRLSFALVFIPAIIVIVNTPLILNVWLPEVPRYTVDFCRLILSCCIIDAVSGPYNCAVMADANIRNYQITISSVFFLDLAISYCLFRVSFPVQYILYSRVLTRGVINLFVGLHFMKKNFSFDISEYLMKGLLPILVFVCIASVSCLFMLHYFDSWILLIVSTAFFMTAGVAGIFFIVLSAHEREIILSFIKNRKTDEVG